MLGKSFFELIPPGQSGGVRKALVETSESEGSVFKVLFVGSDGEIAPDHRFEAFARRQNGAAARWIVELERASLSAAAAAGLYPQARGALARLRAAEDAEDLCARAACDMRELSGFDRVFALRFDVEGNANVRAEDRDPALDSYLKEFHRVSDLPPWSRTGVPRFIADIDSVPTALFAATDEHAMAPLDLSRAVLRAAAIDDAAFMARHEARALLVVPLLREKTPWGLLVGVHHRGPHWLPYDGRSACELYAELVSALLGSKDRAEEPRIVPANVVPDPTPPPAPPNASVGTTPVNVPPSEPLTPETTNHRLQTILRLTRRMEDLVDSLLRYSQLARQRLNRDRTPLGPVFDRALQTLKPLIAEKHARVVLAKPLPTVDCDGARVTELFQLLVANALHFNDAKEPRVEITWRQIGDDRPHIFSIRDNGIGIAQTDFEAIFRLFGRLHGRDEYGGGVGAGLAIAKRIVDKHGGRCWVESTPGAGTVFLFTLDN